MAPTSPPEHAQPNKGRKEAMYDKIPLTKGHLDVIIALLVLAFIVLFVYGALKGNGML